MNNSLEETYRIILSGVAPKRYPTETFFGIVNCGNDTTLEIPKMFPFHGDWGKPTGIYLWVQEKHPMPNKIDIVWLSINERCFYSVEQVLSPKKFDSIWKQYESHNNLEFIIVGMAPYGELAIWLYGTKKSILVEWIKGEAVEVLMRDFLPENPKNTLDSYCAQYYNNEFVNCLPPHDLFDNYMKQFTYRYLPLFDHWDENEEKWTKYAEEELETKPELDYIEEALYDGTHDQLHEVGLLSYHQAGKPKKLAIKWHIKKSEYTAYFWLEDEQIRAIFDKFYGAHPDTKTDFIIHIDPKKKKFQLALYRYGLKEPQILPEEAYQLIVFKNKFEDYRSTYYNQPRGAWIW